MLSLIICVATCEIVNAKITSVHVTAKHADNAGKALLLPGSDLIQLSLLCTMFHTIDLSLFLLYMSFTRQSCEIFQRK